MNTLQLAQFKKQLLQEIGDTTNIEPYLYSIDPIRNVGPKYDDEEDYEASFETKSNTKYKAYIFKNSRDKGETWKMEVEFGVVDKQGFSYDHKATVNKGEVYKVMATMVKIIKDVLDQTKEKGQYIKSIVIEPGKSFEGDERRANLYKAFINKNMPKGSKISTAKDLSYIKILLSKP